MFNTLFCLILGGQNMQKTKLLKFGMFGLLIVIVSFATLVHAFTVTEKREVLLSTSFKVDGGEQRFTAVYVPAPADALDVKVSVSDGTVKFQPYVDARWFEDSLGYVQSRINETAVEMIQYWLFEIDNDTIGCGVNKEDVNRVWYLNFLNEDSYEKEVNLEVTKVWNSQNYQDWI
jgi:hypothetical protein